MARKRLNNTQETIVGFWTREGEIQGQVTKKIVTKDDNVFFLLQVSKVGCSVTDNAGAPVKVAVGDYVGIGRTASLECLGELVKVPGIVYLKSNGQKDIKGGKTFWDIEVEHDDAAAMPPLPGEQMTTKGKHRKVDAKDPLPSEGAKRPDDDIPF